jgi:hypothetical protein
VAADCEVGQLSSVLFFCFFLRSGFFFRRALQRSKRRPVYGVPRLMNTVVAPVSLLPGGVSPTEAFGEKTNALDPHATKENLIGQAPVATNGNATTAAEKLGISGRTLHGKINEMNPTKSQPKPHTTEKKLATQRTGAAPLRKLPGDSAARRSCRLS